jgi:ubiquinone/menaquinone biosynthesis C-methylase UbiE
MIQANSTITFYDNIAAAYDNLLTPEDDVARKKISKIFQNNIPLGKILDFGGGTGKDLPWLLQSGYQVYFLEPSSNMRAIARKYNSEKNHPLFLEKNLDFAHWSTGHVPVDEKMNAVLANFAVLNCLKDIQDFFAKISLVCASEGIVVATVIDPQMSRLIKKYSIWQVLKMCILGHLRIFNRYKENIQETFIYSVSALKKAASGHFNFHSYHRVSGSGFIVIIFSKK